jgi:hypothetical protein
VDGEAHLPTTFPSRSNKVAVVAKVAVVTQDSTIMIGKARRVSTLRRKRS